jgi:hypothetical protein
MNAQQITTQFEALFNAIKARNIATPSKDNDISLSFMVKDEKHIKNGMKHVKNDTFSNYVSMQSSDKKASVSFVAVKANVKILHFLSAIGSKDSAAIDNYSAAIISNTFENDNALTAKSALVTLTKNLEFDALDVVQKIKNRCRVAVTTASTQRSSSREAMRVLNLATVTKNKRDDVISLTDEGTKIFASLFMRDDVVTSEE